MLRTLRNSVAAIAAVSALAVPLAAQTPATPPVTPAPAASAPAAALPQALAELGITDARVLEGRRGQRVEGTLPGGGAFRAMLDDRSQLRMIRVEDEGAALPADILARLVPEAVRSNAIFAEFSRVQGVGRGDEGVMLFGADAKGESIRAGFSADGTLQRFGRGEMGRPSMDRGGDRDKRDDHGKREGRRGPSHDHGRMGPGDGPSGPAGPAGEPQASLDDAAVQRVLSDAGYTQPGAITRDGPRIEVDAVNPEGEPVTVTINPRGVVVRELAR